MAKKISQLTQATQVKSDDVTVIVQDGETKKLPLNMMVTKQDIENKKVTGLAKLDEIEATYENDTYTPTITVKNKSSVKVGEGDGVDYSANVMDGPAKSAILKGQTLVNLVTNPRMLINANDEVTLGDNKISITKSASGISYILFDFLSKPSTEYTIILNFTKFSQQASYYGVYLDGVYGDINSEPFNTGSLGIIKRKFTSKDTVEGLLSIGIHSDIPTGTEIEFNDIMVLEGDYTNIDVPYFTGIQSVKMSVLTTTGKNLIDVNHTLSLTREQNPIANSQDVSGTEFTDVTLNSFVSTTTLPGYWQYACYRISNAKPNTTYILSYLRNTINPPEGGSSRKHRLMLFTSEKASTNLSSLNKRIVAEITTENDGVLFLCLADESGNGGGIGTKTQFTDIQLEEGSVATSYEPYKSNILTVNEPVELRGIGNVKDELNLLTGEVTERIGEVVLDGSVVDNTILRKNGSSFLMIRFEKIGFKKINDTTNIISSKLRNAKYYSSEPFNVGDVVSDAVGWGFGICFATNETATRDEAISYLNSLNPIVQGYLAQESVKTVDLMPSGTHPSTTPYCWKNGHIQLSSSGLLPNLEYSVVTSRAGQINQNATMIVKNDKRIFDLEILLAGGLVNTTYQALTLQNQVETGLSKVSLNSETEPDYLLYHMIMKLIEEKAYKLDDLTEKVSVFYLYEKLSDEQFETIYSALYPFAEDEIIEEPVVEELPEVVEDEVIM